MKRLTRVAAFLCEHERIDGAQFEALFEGTLAPSAGVERKWRSAKSKPRSWNEIDDLIATSVATAAPTTASPVAAVQAIQRHGPRPHRTLASNTRRLLMSIWELVRPGEDRPVD
jgi:hypothetical protein